jgi:hypothetical protein
MFLNIGSTYIYGHQQRASGKFKRSNEFSNNLSKPRSSIRCDELIDPTKHYLQTPTITSWSYQGGNKVNGEFKYKENALDHEPSTVWGHGTQGAMAQARGT